MRVWLLGVDIPGFTVREIGDLNFGKTDLGLDMFSRVITDQLLRRTSMKSKNGLLARPKIIVVLLYKIMPYSKIISMKISRVYERFRNAVGFLRSVRFATSAFWNVNDVAARTLIGRLVIPIDFPFQPPPQFAVVDVGGGDIMSMNDSGQLLLAFGPTILTLTHWVGPPLCSGSISSRRLFVLVA